MSAVEVMISGVLYDKLSRTARPVLICGEASLAGLGVGGGPIQPPAQPPGIWGGGNEGFPTPPIPIYPGGTPNPPGIWGPNDPRPGWGLPGGGGGPPTELPENPEEPKPPPPGGGWGWSPDYGWGYFPGHGGKPQPMP